jgi:hypothetical protein
MRYSDRPRPTLSITELVTHIAETATGGDVEAALADFLHAARDGAIEVFDDTGQIVPRDRWGTEINAWPLGRFIFGPFCPIWQFFGTVRRPDAERLWSGEGGLAGQAAQVDNPNMPTGAPGRPTKGMHLVRGEFQRRLGLNACKLRLCEEATELQKWFKSQYPNASPPTIKTIENNIRTDFRHWVASQHKAEV